MAMWSYGGIELPSAEAEESVTQSRTYRCQRCEVFGSDPDLEAPCWCCGLGDELVRGFGAKWPGPGCQGGQSHHDMTREVDEDVAAMSWPELLAL